MNSPQGAKSLEGDKAPLGCGCSGALLDELAEIGVVSAHEPAVAVGVGEGER